MAYMYWYCVFWIFFIAEFFKKASIYSRKFFAQYPTFRNFSRSSICAYVSRRTKHRATGLFKNVLNFSDYQLMGYYGILTLGALGGGLGCLCIHNYERSYGMVLFVAALIPIGSFLSMNLSIDMLPSNIYLGQFLIAFASVFFYRSLACKWYYFRCCAWNKLCHYLCGNFYLLSRCLWSPWISNY